MAINYCCWNSISSAVAAFKLPDKDLVGGFNMEGFMPYRSCRVSEFQGLRGANLKAFASQNQIRKSRKGGKTRKSDTTLQPNKTVLDEQDGNAEEYMEISSFNNSEERTNPLVPSRRVVLQACTFTSCLIGALGVIVRQGSHFLYEEGWPVIDCSTEIPFTFELWHFELIAGLVVLVSSCRYLLLNTWPDFAESSEAANRQVLTSLEPLDYVVVAFLSGISEELLFRGALLPILGLNWASALAVAALFGILHIGSGRKYSFAVWATFVGIAYGYATISSSNIIVPMTSHALNNLVGGIIWRYSSNSSKK